jgi:hypothetical protein
MENEIWKDIPGYEGLYQVSNLGRVKSLPRQLGARFRNNDYFLKPYIDKAGYYRFSLMKDNKFKHFCLHRLVAICFISNPENKKTVNHEDGDKSNNTIGNLSWMTMKENNIHAYNNGLKLRCDGHGMAKLTNNDVLEIRELLKTMKQCDIAKKYNVYPTTISRIAVGINWKSL